MKENLRAFTIMINIHQILTISALILGTLVNVIDHLPP